MRFQKLQTYTRTTTDAFEGDAESLAAFLGDTFDEGAQEAGADQLDDRKRAAVRLAEEARAWWESRSTFRTSRREARDLYRGYQWNAYAVNEAGETVTEKKLLEDAGRYPAVMNMIAPLIANVEGQFRQNRSARAAFAVERADEEAVRMLNVAREGVRRMNQSAVIEADQFLEHLLSGASGFKSTFEFDQRTQRSEIRDYEVEQTRLFFNTDLYDRRLKGLRIIGEIHDVTPAEAVRAFARSRREAERVAAILGPYTGDPYLAAASASGFDAFDAEDFRTSAFVGKSRVVEVWHPVYRWVRMALDPLFEAVPEGYGMLTMSDGDLARAQNERRRMGLPLLEVEEKRYLPFWHCFFLTPDGDILLEQPTPFLHGEHPYAVGLARWVDGETWGLVENVRDPQKWLNRLLVGIDYTMTAGSKGAIAYDKSFIKPTETSDADVNAWYTSTNKTLGLDVPQSKKISDFIHTQVAEALPAGYFELVPVLTQFVERISGVSEAAQGMAPKSGTPATLYQQQIMQATVNVLAYIQTFFDLLRSKDRKEIALVQQAYDEPREIARPGTKEVVRFEPERVRALDFDVALGDVADTATWRQLQEAELRADLEAGLIPYEIYLKHSARPNAEALLQDYSQHQQMVAMQQQAQMQQAMQMEAEQAQMQQQQEGQKAERERQEKALDRQARLQEAQMRQRPTP